MCSTPPTFSLRRTSSANSGWTIRRLWWRFLCQGSGKNSSSRSRLASATQWRSTSSASQLYTRTLPRPWVSRPLSSAPTPGLCTSTPMKSMSGAAAAISRVEWPMPKPISKVRGAWRPKIASKSWTSSLSSRPNFGQPRSRPRCWPSVMRPARITKLFTVRIGRASSCSARESWAGDCGVSLMEKENLARDRRAGCLPDASRIRRTARPR